MVDVAEITDRDSLEAWLQDRSREDAVMIAHRAAMRVAPIYWRWVAQRPKGELTELPVLRSCLISGVAGTWANREIRSAASSATESILNSGGALGSAAESILTSDDDLSCAVAAANSADDALSAAYAASTADSAPSSAHAAAAAGAHAAEAAEAAHTAEFWRAVAEDCTALVASALLIELPLWHDARSPIDDISNQVRQGWSKRGPGWNFWINWYDDALAGREPNQRLLTNIALIDPGDWDKGIDHVNGLIEGIHQ